MIVFYIKDLWKRFIAWFSGWPISAPKKDCYRDTEEDMLFRKRLEELAKQDKKKTKKKSKDEHIKKKNKIKKKTKKGNIE